MRYVFSLCALVLFSAGSLPARGIVRTASAVVEPSREDATELSTPFAVTGSTRIPGKTLKRGAYSIRVIDHLSDRIILRVENPQGKEQATFLALQNASLRSGEVGPIAYAGGADTMRGFAFPGGSTVEFVYPKAEAVNIAKENASKVPAIDPESDGRTSSKNLSHDDMQVVTLWMLSATTVGPANNTQAAIKAERYQAPVQVAQTNSTDSASSARSVRGGLVPTNRTAGLRTAPDVSVADQPAPRIHRVALKALPHTASDLTMLGVMGGLLLLFAGTLRTLRLVKVRAQ